MNREGFRNRMKQYKKAREENPGLKYWEWKDIPKYDEGTGSVGMPSTTSADGRIKYVYYYPTMDLEYQNINLPEVTITGNKNAGKRLPMQVPEGSYERFKTLGEIGKTVGSFLPVVGEMIDTYDLATDIKNKNWINTAARIGGYFVPNVLEKGGKQIYHNLMKNVQDLKIQHAFNKLNKSLDSADFKNLSVKNSNYIKVTETNTSTNTYNFGVRDRNREFLKTFNKWNKRYGYPPLSLKLADQPIAEMENEIKQRLIEHNTFMRGVRDEDFNDAINKTNKILEDRGIIPTSDERLKFYATTYAPQTGAGRAGFNSDDAGIGTTYTSNSYDTGKGYALNRSGTEMHGKVAKVQRPIDFTGDYYNWVQNAEFSFNNDAPSQLYEKYELPYLLKTGKSLKQQVLKTKNIKPLSKAEAEAELIQRNGFNEEFLDLINSSISDSGIALSMQTSGLNLSKIIENQKLINRVLNKAFPYKGQITAEHFKDLHPTDKSLLLDAVKETNLPNVRKYYSELGKKEADRMIKNKQRSYFAKMSKVSEEDMLLELLSKNVSPSKTTDNIFTTEQLVHTSRNKGNPYQHFVFTGPIGEKSLEFVEFLPDDFLKEVNSTRMHVGKYTPSFSRKSYAEGGQVEPDPLEVLERIKPKELLKAGFNRQRAYNYASPELGIAVLPGITKGFDYTIRGANYTHAVEDFVK